MESMHSEERLQLPDHVPGPIKRLLEDYGQTIQLIVNKDTELRDEDDSQSRDIKKLKRATADPEARVHLLRMLDKTLTTMETIAHEHGLGLDAWVESYRGDITRIVNKEANYTRGVFEVFDNHPKVLVRRKQKAHQA